MNAHKLLLMFIGFILLHPSAGAQDCTLPSSDLKKNCREAIGEARKADAIFWGHCLTASEPTADTNFILLAIAYLSDSVSTRNSPDDTLNSIINLKSALQLNARASTCNTIAELSFHILPAPYDSALKYYRQSISFESKQAIAYQGLSRVYESIGDTAYKTCSHLTLEIDSLSKVEEDLRRANSFALADREKGSIIAKRKLFNHLIDTLSGYYDTSISNIEKCISFNSSDTPSLNYRKTKIALILKKNEFRLQSDLQEAVPDLIIMSKQNDSLLKANAYYFLGSIAERKNNTDSALINYRQSVLIDREQKLYWEALLRVIGIQCKRNKICNPQEEEFVLENLIRIDTNQTAYYFRLGYLYDSLGFEDKKWELYRNGEKRFGARQPYFSEMLQNYQQLKPQMDSLENLVSGLSSELINNNEHFSEEYFQGLRLLAINYFQVGYFIKAGYLIQRLISFYPQDDSLKILQANIDLQKNFAKNSLHMARKAKRQGKDYLDYEVIAYNLESKNAHLRSRWKYQKAIRQINKLISNPGRNTSMIDDSELKQQKKMIYSQMAESLFERKRYRRGKKIIDRSAKT